LRAHLKLRLLVLWAGFERGLVAMATWVLAGKIRSGGKSGDRQSSIRRSNLLETFESETTCTYIDLIPEMSHQAFGASFLDHCLISGIIKGQKWGFVVSQLFEILRVHMCYTLPMLNEVSLAPLVYSIVYYDHIGDKHVGL